MCSGVQGYTIGCKWYTAICNNVPGFSLKCPSYMCSCPYNNKLTDLNVVTNY